MKDHFEVYPQTRRKKILGWRFKLVKDGESILTSNGCYETAEEAARVADVLSKEAFTSAYRVVMPTAKP